MEWLPLWLEQKTVTYTKFAPVNHTDIAGNTEEECLHWRVWWEGNEEWQHQSPHQISWWWHHFPLSCWRPSVLELSSRNTGYLYSYSAPTRMWETYGKYCHLYWLPVNPTSPQLSWSRQDDPWPALLPCQADSSVPSIMSIPPKDTRSCGTDRKWNSRQVCKNQQSGSTDNDPILRLKQTQQTIIFCLHTEHCHLIAHLKSINISDSTLWVKTGWPNPRPHPSILSKICWKKSANMAAWCWSSDQAVECDRRPLLNHCTEDLTCMAVNCWLLLLGQPQSTTHGSLSPANPVIHHCR